MPSKTKKTAFISYPSRDYETFISSVCEFDIVYSYEDADLIVFTGGTDISPDMYGHARSSFTGTPDVRRDKNEEALFHKAKADGKKMFGICRGAQLLCALSGGHLIQHADGHGRWHEVVMENGKTFEVSSSHHQIMVPLQYHRVLAWSKKRLSHSYWDEKGQGKEEKLFEGKEVEAAFFPAAKALAIQWHPEWMAADEDGSRVVKGMLKVMFS